MKSKINTNLALEKSLSGTELRIILLCSDSELTQVELCELLEMKKSNVSASIKKIMNLGILNLRQHGTFKYYSLNKKWEPSKMSPETLPGQYEINTHKEYNKYIENAFIEPKKEFKTSNIDYMDIF